MAAEMTMRSDSPCHICGAAAVDIVAGFKELGRATSDCRPWPAGGSLGVCGTCGAVQHPVDREWHAETAKIYSDYQAYRQSVAGAEQHVFDPATGSAIPRSQKILRWLSQKGHLPANGRMLDVGCGNGAMLRAFAVVAGGGWELNGFEPHLASDAELRAIPGVRHVWSEDDLSNTDESYDFITLSHSLEHIPDPVAYLAALRGRLAPGGRLLIEVPYFLDSPYDLLVADHCTHFTMGVFRRVLSQAGYAVDALRNDVVAKELTAVALHANQPSTSITSDAAEIARGVENAVAWLHTMQAQAFDAATRQPFGIFGTAIGASWLLGVLGERVQFFVDEDPARAGTRYFNRPVLRPQDLRAGATIYMALPRGIAEDVTARLGRKDVDFLLPPDYTKRLNEGPMAI
jgi:SAM-dependent methyltransferase